MQRRISPDQVRVGMYVCGFGGSWFDHPFWRVKFVIKTTQDVERIRQSRVPDVLIDDSLGGGVIEEDAPASTKAPATSARPRTSRQATPSLRIYSEEVVDYDALRRKEDRKRAVALVSRSMNTMRQAFEAGRLGRAVRLSEVTSLVDDIAESVERSPRTLLDVLRLKKKDEYTYLHSVAVCALMVNVARHLDKGEAETRDLGLAGLLHDIGKMGVPDPILNKPGQLTDDEFATVRTHPEHGYRVLSGMPNISEMALDVCHHHHEKIDGSGYPFGLNGEQISLAARLGAVCDVYDALTSDRAYKAAWSPAQGLGAMWNWDGHFDRQLLFSFMQSIAIFPAGMLVQLRSNRLGVVLENKGRNTRPRVLAFYDTRERCFIEPVEIVIKDNLANDSIVAAADAAEWGIPDWDAKLIAIGGGKPSPLAA